MRFDEASIGGEPSVVQIHDDNNITVSLQSLTLKLASEYAYVSDPPIFADMGTGYIYFKELSGSFDASGVLVQDEETGETDFELLLSNAKLSQQAEPFCNYDGISDFSEVVTNTVNTFAAVVRNRLLSIVNGGPTGEETYPELEAKVQGLINTVLGLIPSQIDIKDTGLYLDGFLYSGI